MPESAREIPESERQAREMAADESGVHRRPDAPAADTGSSLDARFSISPRPGDESAQVVRIDVNKKRPPELPNAKKTAATPPALPHRRTAATLSPTVDAAEFHAGVEAVGAPFEVVAEPAAEQQSETAAVMKETLDMVADAGRRDGVAQQFMEQAKQDAYIEAQKPLLKAEAARRAEVGARQAAEAERNMSAEKHKSELQKEHEFLANAPQAIHEQEEKLARRTAIGPGEMNAATERSVRLMEEIAELEHGPTGVDMLADTLMLKYGHDVHKTPTLRARMGRGLKAAFNTGFRAMLKTYEMRLQELGDKRQEVDEIHLATMNPELFQARMEGRAARSVDRGAQRHKDKGPGNANTRI